MVVEIPDGTAMPDDEMIVELLPETAAPTRREISSQQITDYVRTLDLVAKTLRVDNFVGNALLANQTDETRAFWISELVARGHGSLLDNTPTTAGTRQVFPHP